jgi:hypothetical protein
MQRVSGKWNQDAGSRIPFRTYRDTRKAIMGRYLLLWLLGVPLPLLLLIWVFGGLS